MEQNDFANVAWQNNGGQPPAVLSPEGEGEVIAENGSRRRGNRSTGIGDSDGILECTVASPLKEGDGTKDAYISYLITTNVSL